MNNLHFAIIASYNCVKYLNELEELTEEQRDLLFDFESKAWAKVNEDDMQDINFSGEYSSLYQAVKKEVLEVLQDNKLTFADSRCYDYLIGSFYESMRKK